MADGRAREPWRRFEAKVDPDARLAPAERARRAKIAYRAHMRSIARKSVKARASKKARREAAERRRLARPPTQRELADLEAWERERRDHFRFLAIWAAAQRGLQGLADLRRHQLKKRADCVLCGRPFSEEDRTVRTSEAVSASPSPRRPGPPRDSRGACPRLPR